MLDDSSNGSLTSVYLNPDQIIFSSEHELALGMGGQEEEN
jgi:hypothetical protein